MVVDQHRTSAPIHSPLPFDGKRMIYGELETIIDC